MIWCHLRLFWIPEHDGDLAKLQHGIRMTAASDRTLFSTARFFDYPELGLAIGWYQAGGIQRLGSPLAD